MNNSIKILNIGLGIDGENSTTIDFINNNSNSNNSTGCSCSCGGSSGGEITLIDVLKKIFL